MVEKASVAAISVTRFFLKRTCVPNSREPDTSMSSITVFSRSSSNILMKGRLNRAVTFQSMLRTSSPN